jgi:FlaA1/EpsC-like NDP-sugar epimerase
LARIAASAIALSSRAGPSSATHVSLPVTERLTRESLVLPLHHEVTEADQERIVDLLASSLTATAGTEAVAEALLIVGAGGCARETAAAVLEIAELDRLGFLDYDPVCQGQQAEGLSVLGPAEAVHDHPDARVVVCTGNAGSYDLRRRLVERLAVAPDRYVTIHPCASIGCGTILGAGSVVLCRGITDAQQERVVEVLRRAVGA